MTDKIPEAIRDYFISENAHDPEAIDRCFAPDGIVRDEARTIQGLAAIKAWRRETAAKYAHTVEVTGCAHQDGKVVVTGRVSGNFPGSPILLDHTFTLADGRIASLEIG
ncbi:MAG: nuclear transport factor 2 family protein [Magnetospirillum sp.]|nr:nuclear transport factor 2 family protein [Magnetospirillum sp.]